MGEFPDESGVGVTTAARLMRQASLKLPERDVEEPAVVREMPQPVKHAEPAKTPAKTAKLVETKTAAAASSKKAGDKKAELGEKPMTKPIRVAKNDPLAPLPAKANLKKTARDTGTPR